MSLYDDAFDRAERAYLSPPREPQEIGICYICGWPVYETTGELTADGYKHFTCVNRSVND
jgi:hypothetical protein